MPILVELWGPGACFTRPEFKVERVSYDVPTPSAIRGILESIYWHPGVKWIIDKIYVLNPIEFVNIRRNEVSEGVSSEEMKKFMNGGRYCFKDPATCRAQRTTIYLRNVRYVVAAHFVLTDKCAPDDNPGKIQDIMNRRLEKGACYSMPYFGTREFPANFRPWTAGKEIETIPVTQDLGYMLYDMDFSDAPNNIIPTFFRCQMDKGVIDLQGCEVLR